MCFVPQRRTLFRLVCFVHFDLEEMCFAPKRHIYACIYSYIIFKGVFDIDMLELEMGGCEARRSQDSKRQMCHADLDFAVEDAAWAAWLACGRRAPKAHPAPRATAAVEQCKPFTSMSYVGNLKRPTQQNHTFSLYIIC
jgi:hypothetical protein